MRSARKLALGAAALAALAVALWPSLRDDGGASQTSSAEPDAATATARLDARERPVATARTALSAPTVAPLLRGRLRGLHPDAPWDAPLSVRYAAFEAASRTHHRTEATANVAADGAFAIARVHWLERVATCDLALHAEPRFYLPVARELAVPRDLPAGELVVDVRVVGLLTGRVLDPEGQPVAAARVATFATGSAPDGQTSTAADGTFTLPAPPDLPLLVAIAAMEETRLSGRRLTGRGGAISETGELRTDLLPAAISAQARAGRSDSLGDVALSAAATVRGRAVFADGGPVADVAVRIRPRGDRALTLGPNSALIRHESGRLAPAATRQTDADGYFTCPAIPGVPTTIELDLPPGYVSIGGVVAVEAAAPAVVELRVPQPVIVRVTQRGVAVRSAVVEVPKQRLATDGSGELRVVLHNAATQSYRARGEHGRRRSAWLDLVNTPAGARVDLELVEELAPVRLEIAADAPVRQMLVVFTPGVATDVGETVVRTLHRDDRSGPFLVHVPAGRYRLRIEGAPGERNGTFLLPSTHDLVVPDEGGSWTLPMQLGGRLSLEVVDDQTGARLAGVASLIDAQGQLLQPRFRGSCAGPAGQLALAEASETADVLAPGIYRVEVALPTGQILRNRVEVRAREVATLLLRAP